MEPYQAFITKHPHNLSVDAVYFDKLLALCLRINETASYQINAPDSSTFIQKCVEHYGGTLTEALIDYLNNH